MYLTTHLVRSPSGKEGVNAFLHEHGPAFAWPENPSILPEVHPGTLVRQRTEQPPGGNSVRAYLDVLVPDGTRREDIERALKVVLDQLSKSRNPLAITVAPATIRFGVEAALEGAQRQYLRMLSASLLELFDAREPGSPGA